MEALNSWSPGDTVFVHDDVLPELIRIHSARHFDDRRLKIHEYESGVVVPGTIDFGGGLFANGKVVPDSDFAGRGAKEYNGEAEFVDEDVLYIGQVFPTWGHCLTDFLAQAWPLLQPAFRDGAMKCVYITHSTGVEMPRGYVRLFELLGVNPQRVVRITRPTRYRKVLFPELSFWRSGIRMRSYTQEFVDTLDKIRDSVTAKSPLEGGVERIYLSRTAWQKFGWGRGDFGEQLVERAFEEHYDCQVVHPEKYSLDEQIAMMKNATLVVTTDGSIAHNIVFCRDGVDVVILRKSQFINVHQPALNEMRKVNATYIDVYGPSWFFDKEASYLGPFLIFINSRLAKFLNIPRQFSVLSFAKYVLCLIIGRARSMAGRILRFVRSV